MRTPSRALLTLLLLPGLAGCLQPDGGGGDGEADGGGAAQPGAVDPAALLASLETPVVPDAARLVDDLEVFVALAPRRYENRFEHDASRDWLEQQFLEAGLNVTRHGFDGVTQVASDPTPGQNIIGVKPGRDPNRLIVFSAHYDSAVTSYGGAYDDGSGTLIVVALARALAAYEWEHTLVFAEFDQEESGLVGSEAYVQDLLEQGYEVTLNVNFDMTGINWPAKAVGGTLDTPVQVFFGGETTPAYGDAWKTVVQSLGHPPESSEVTVTPSPPSSGPSDHGSFWAAGMPAVWVRGAVIGNYPMYHTADTVESMIVDVGGDRADLVAGFDTVLQRTFLFTFVLDRLAAAPPPFEA